jgi:sugar phosphate isomerase/epimerase
MTGQRKAESFQWGFSTLGCADLSLSDICRLLIEFGMPELEVRAIDGRTDLPQWAVETGWTAARAKSQLAKKDIHFLVAGSSFKLVGNDEKSRDELLAFAAWAESWGANYVRAFGGGTWGTSLTGTDFQQAAETIAWWRKEKSQRGWRIEMLLETHDAFSASAPCVQLQQLLPEPVGIIWDSHHTWRLGGESPRQSWAQLGRWVRHVHVKDSIDKPSARHPYTYVLPGDGEMPLAETLAVLREKQFSGCVSLEWERMWHPYLPPLRDALIRLKALPWFAPVAHEIQSVASAR